MSTSASIARQELVLARSDLKTALAALTVEERRQLESLPKKVLALRRACRFCSVVPIMIPPVWTLFIPRMRTMWKCLRSLDEHPRVHVVLRELELLPHAERQHWLDGDPALQGALAKSELRALLRFATFAPPVFMGVIAIAIHFVIFG